jgi:hypothetical protein
MICRTVFISNSDYPWIPNFSLPTLEMGMMYDVIIYLDEKIHIFNVAAVGADVIICM